MQAAVRTWRRQAAPVLLTGALAYVFVAWTLPALRDLRDMRRQQALVEAGLQRRQQDVRAMEAWIWGIQQDPLTRRRLLELQRFAADVTGPVVVPGEDAGPR